MQAAFATKISPERVLKEVDKMFEGRNPHISALQMHQFKILPIALKPPTEIAELTPERVDSLIEESVATANTMGVLLSNLKQDLSSKLGGIAITDYLSSADKFKFFQKCCMYSALLLPFQEFSFTKKKKTVIAVQHILTESLRQKPKKPPFATR